MMQPTSTASPTAGARPALAVAFSDQVRGFDVNDNMWLTMLKPNFSTRVVEPDAGADVLYYSDWGDRHRSFNGRKVYYTGENMLPDYEECDFAFTSSLHPGDPRHHRLPYYACSLGDPAALIRRSDFDPEQILRSETGFCCFVASNPRSPERNRFFRILNRRLRVDSGGRHFNNVGGPVKHKNAFLRSHKFTIAFENTAHPGYTTEKIVDAMLADSVPIYWGNPEVSRDFNTDSFIDASRFRSLEALADHVIEVHADDALYLRYLRQPWLQGNRLHQEFDLGRAGRALTEWIRSGDGPRPRRYRPRRLRSHAYSSSLEQAIVSIRCRAESALWKLGLAR